MPTAVAIHLSPEEATLITAEAVANSTIRVIHAIKIAFSQLPLHTSPAGVSPGTLPLSATSALAGLPHNPHVLEANVFSQDEPSSDRSPYHYHRGVNGVPLQVKNGTSTRKFFLEDILQHEVDTTFGVISGAKVVFEHLTLPFEDPKKLDQIVPIQVQDVLPFDIDKFLVDNVVIGKKQNSKNEQSSKFEILSCLIPQAEVAAALEHCFALGADPKVLTTTASAITGLAKLCRQDLPPSYGLLVFSQTQCSLAFFVNSQLKSLRELPLEISSSSPKSDQNYSVEYAFENLSQHLRCSLASLEHLYDQRIEDIYAIKPPPYFSTLALSLGIRLSELSLDRYIEKDSSVRVSANDFSWALGLFAHEFSKRKKDPQVMINFRRGAFAFQPAWSNLAAAFQEEKSHFARALFWGIFWIGSMLFASNYRLGVIENTITKRLRIALPEVTFPLRGEVSSLEEKVHNLEEQLRGLGSLSSLSPLESFKELSLAIVPEIDISVEALSIGHSGLAFHGSVLNIPQIGKLSSELESRKGKFCKVKVEPRGQVPGSTRAKFSAEVTFCE